MTPRLGNARSRGRWLNQLYKALGIQAGFPGECLLDPPSVHYLFSPAEPGYSLLSCGLCYLLLHFFKDMAFKTQHGAFMYREGGVHLLPCCQGFSSFYSSMNHSSIKHSGESI